MRSISLDSNSFSPSLGGGRLERLEAEGLFAFSSLVGVEEEEDSPPESVDKVADAVGESEKIFLFSWDSYILCAITKSNLFQHLPRVLNCRFRRLGLRVNLENLVEECSNRV